MSARKTHKIPRNVWSLGLVSLFMDLSSEMIHALLPIYLVTILGASALQVGVIEGLAEATASFTKVFSGAISDWIGKRKLLAAIGYGLAAFTKPLFPLAPSIGWIVAARFIDRVGKGVRGAPRDALIADSTPEDLRGAAFGLRQTLDTIGAFLGPLTAIVLMLATANNYTLVFWAAVAPAFISFALIALAVDDAPGAQTRATPRFPLRRSEIARLPRSYWLVIAIAAIFTLARFSEAFLILKAQQTGLAPALVPAVLVVMNIVYALASYPAGAWSDRPGGRARMLVAGLLLLIMADLVLAFAPDIATSAAGVALWGLHMGLTQGVLSALVADAAPADLRGTGFGLFNLVTGAALLTASVVAGALWERAGASATFLASAAFAALALALYAALRKSLDAQLVSDEGQG
ncbi:MAG: MFS transporter [Hyphomicrobiales bacterium]|nr:MFS transporter [Hyphomicrobiales bacterium]